MSSPDSPTPTTTRFDFVAKLDFFPAKVDAVMRRDLGAALSVVYLDLNTDICNHNCSFCDGFYRTLHAGHLPYARVSRLIDEMEELGVLSIVLAGDRGEPLLHPEIEPILRRVAASPIQFGLYTNGTVIDDGLWPHLENAAFVRVSADAATAATHAALHGYPPQRNDFDALLRNVTHLASVVADLGVSFVLTPSNAQEIAAAADLFLSRGARFIEYKPHYLPGYTLDAPWLRLSAGHIRQQIDAATAAWGARVVLNNQIVETLAARPQALTTSPRACLASTLRLVISTHGCYTCTPYRGEQERRVGDILTQSLREVVESSARRDLLQHLCSRICAYHDQNEALLAMDRHADGWHRRADLPSVPQDFFI